MLLLCEPQLHIQSVGAVTEHWHFLACVIRTYHHVERYALARTVLACFCLSITCASEQQRRGFLNVGLVGLTNDLKVCDAAEVVVLDGFREVEDDIIARAEDAVARFRRTEQSWTACVLYTAQHFR